MIHTSNLSIAHFSHPCEITPERSRLGRDMYIVAYTLKRDTVCYGRKPRQRMQEIAVHIVSPIGNPCLQLSLYFVYSSRDLSDGSAQYTFHPQWSFSEILNHTKLLMRSHCRILQQMLLMWLQNEVIRQIIFTERHSGKPGESYVYSK